MNMFTKAQSRIQDDIASKNPAFKIKLNRRLKNKERRNLNCFSYDYKGPARRLTIDRRLKIT